jgi:hypothetical protein
MWLWPTLTSHVATCNDWNSEKYLKKKFWKEKQRQPVNHRFSSLSWKLKSKWRKRRTQQPLSHTATLSAQ